MMENYHEEGRQCRLRKKSVDPTRCPVCTCTLRASEIENHYSIEIDRLHKLNSNNKSRKSLNSTTLNNEDSGHSSNATTIPSTITTGSSVTNNDANSECWGTFQKIKNNRQMRLKQKSRKRKAEEVICPVCNERTSEDISLHVEFCLKKSEKNSNRNGNNISDEDLDDDDDDSIDIEGEEYEWAGQTRIRASTLLEGGYAGVGLGINNSRIIDEDEDLIVDGDDTQIYGLPQYSERDVIPLNTDNRTEDNDSLYLRNLVIGNNPGVNLLTNNIREDDNDNKQFISNNQNNKIETNKLKNEIKIINNNSHQYSDSASTQIIESLKDKIKVYENLIKNKSKCLICLDEFKIAVVSICCWHVHCEECWLHTLGARKLCPQCNMITSPSDLRRIYM